MKITVFTPTYNRGYCIEKLYKSLLNQNFEKFEWLIIDDGSTDNTEILIHNLINKSKLDIRYYKQINSGKYSSINKGIDLAKGKLFFIVDSDDYLSNDALHKINLWSQEILALTNSNEFIGVSGLKADYNGSVIGTKTNDGYLDATSAEYRYKYKIKGDRAEVFFTEKLKEYKFPKIDGIKTFQTEAIIFNKMSMNNEKIRWYNEIIYLAEYRDDGLSKNLNKLKLENWNGYIYYYNQILTMNIPFIEKIRQISNYYRVGLQIKNIFELYADINKSLISYICMPVGYIYYFKDKIRHSKIKN